MAWDKKTYYRKRMDLHRSKVAEIKIQSGCVDCGYNTHHSALEFDHKENSGLPYSGKQRTVASLMCSSFETILKEIAKCDVVCANCHAIRTHNRRKPL